MQRVEDVKDNVAVYMTEFQKLLVESKDMMSQIGTEKYAAEVVSDVAKHITKTNKLLKLLEMMMSKEYNESALANLIKLVDEVRSSHKKPQAWAAEFGYKDATKKKKRAKDA